jgi:hypothetical protein
MAIASQRDAVGEQLAQLAKIEETLDRARVLISELDPLRVPESPLSFVFRQENAPSDDRLKPGWGDLILLASYRNWSTTETRELGRLDLTPYFKKWKREKGRVRGDTRMINVEPLQLGPWQIRQLHLFFINNEERELNGYVIRRLPHEHIPQHTVSWRAPSISSLEERIDELMIKAQWDDSHSAGAHLRGLKKVYEEWKGVLDQLSDCPEPPAKRARTE